jgi:signal peptidase I
VAVAGMVSFAALVGFWAISGGRWFVVQTPSMGRSAPVGTLLWVKPARFSSLHVGEIITFHPPGTHETYSHRIFAVAADGTLTTKGDINAAADPWKVQPSDVVGAVVMRWWGFGWVVKATPVLAGGGVALLLLVRYFTRDKWRTPAITAGVAIIVALAIFVYRPLVRGVLLRTAPGPGPGQTVHATYVSTGLFPTKFASPKGGSVVLKDGQIGQLLATHPARHNLYVVNLAPHLVWWWWALLLFACFLPALWTLTVGVVPREVEVESGARTPPAG